MAQINLKKRYHELDGLRGVAALAIFIYHCLPALGETAFYFFKPFCRTLWLGVDLFFVLSGFLITRILICMKEHPQRYRTFYMRRALRIFPLAFFALTVVHFVLILNPVMATAVAKGVSPLWYFTFTYNIFTLLNGHWGPMGFTNHFWTLCVEEQFYLLWPLLVFNLPAKRLPVLMLSLALVAVAGKWLFYLNGIHFTAGLACPLTRMDALCLGGLVAYAQLNWPRKDCLKWSRILVYLSGAYLYYLFVARQGLIVSQAWTIPHVTPAAAVFFAGLIYLLIEEDSPWPLLRRGVSHSALRLLGKYSYGIYVYHWIVFYATTMLNAFGTRLGNPWLNFLWVGVLTLSISILSYHRLEKPFLRWKERIT